VVAVLKSEKTPRLGFVGVGWIGTHRLRSIAASASAEIVAIADAQPEAAAAASKAIAEGTAPPLLCDFQTLLNQPLDGVVIATPNSDHAAQCLAALDRGLSVFCQKPLARTYDEVARIVEAARARDLLLDVDFCYRHVAGVAQMKSLIAAGVIGNVYAADLTFHNAYGPDKPWFFDARSVGGGCAMDLGIHLIDLALWLLEYPELERVTSKLYRDGRRLRAPYEELENFAAAELSFTGGATARLACSWHLPAGRDAVIEATFYGTRGALRLRNLNGSFYDFVVEQCEGTRGWPLSAPSREWGGVGICNWARRLASSPRFQPGTERIEDVHRTLDAIYER
jgi:predicted dehydrogenase